ncbi:MAG: hypothetical protein KH415_09485 [Clostridium sp.]|nr:hypothetical protein [Clostridium sp.]
MIEAMEQKIITNLKGHFLKNEKLRRNISIDSTSDALRIICSSRSSFYPLFNALKTNPKRKENLESLFIKISEVYDFILLESNNYIIFSYENPEIKDIKKKEFYISQVSIIKKDLNDIKNNVCSMTLDKLLAFHNIY